MKKIINKKDFEKLVKSVSEITGCSEELPQKDYEGYSVQFYVVAFNIGMNVFCSSEEDFKSNFIGKYEFGNLKDWACEQLQESALIRFRLIISEYVKSLEQEEPVVEDNAVPDISDVLNAPEEPVNVVESITYNNRKEQAEAFTEAIRREFSIAGSAQLATALLIKTVYEKKLFEVLGYENLYDYANSEFGIARGTTSNWLMLATNFGVYVGAKDMYVLDSRLSDYTITQLVLLRSLKIEQIQELGFTPDLTCKQIKDKLSVLNLHITKGAKVPSKKIPSEEEVPEEDYSEEELYKDCETGGVSKGEPRAKLTFTVKGGTSLMDAQIAVLQQMVQKETGKTFEIKVFVK